MNNTRYFGRGVVVVAVVVLVAAAGLLFSGWLRNRAFQLQQNRRSAVVLYHALKVGMTSNQATAIMTKQGGFKVSLISGDLWAISPLIIPASNWNVIVSVSKGKVSKVAIRDADVMTQPPPEAPEDKSV